MGTSYIDTYNKQLDERKFALLRALAGWWTASTRKQGEEKARENVLTQIGAMRSYLDTLEQDIQKEEVTS